MTVSDFDRQHIQEILDNRDQYYTWFSAHLIRLIAKADGGNRERLRLAFPDAVEAFEDWYHRRGFYAPKEVAS